MPRQIICILLLTFRTLFGWSQPGHHFTVFTSKDGLQVKNVMDILQDRRGMMWFATWDGLYQFDGYTFRNFKSVPGDRSALKGNRFDKIMEDSLGSIWVKSYEGAVYRFNSLSGGFDALPFGTYHTTGFYPMEGGRVWVTTSDSRLFKIDTDRESGLLHAAIARMGRGNSIHQAFSDPHRRQWILADNGLYQYVGRRLRRVLRGRFLAATQAGGITYFTSTGGRVYAFDGRRFSMFRLKTDAAVTHAKASGSHRVVFGTAGDGVFCYDTPPENTFRHYRLDGNNDIISLYCDRSGGIWADSRQIGVRHLKVGDSVFRHLPLYDKYGKELRFTAPSMIIEDRNGQLWVSPGSGGLAWYDHKNDRLVPFCDKEQTYWSIETNLAIAYSDRQGDLWFCPKNIGLRRATFKNNIFNVLKTGQNDYDLNIRGLMQDRHGIIWVGSKEGTVLLYDGSLRPVGRLRSDGSIGAGGAQFGRVYCFYEDHRGNVWIGTKGNGLFRAEKTGPQQYRISHFETGNGRYDLTSNDIFSLHEDRMHRLWIATYGGGINILDLNRLPVNPSDHSSVRFFSHRNLLKNYPYEACDRTRFVTSDRQGRIWICTTGGLILADGPQKDPRFMRFRLFTHDPNDFHSLSYNDIHMVCFSRQGDMYVCTNGGGFDCLLKLTNDSIRLQPYTQRDGAGSDIVFSAVEDVQGNIWFCSEGSLSKFNPRNKDIETFTYEDIPADVSFDEGPPVAARNGQLLFPTYNAGIVCFDPRRIKADTFVPPIVFTDFLQEMNSVKPNEDGILQTDIDNTRQIRLPHNRNSFSIAFAALDMKNSDKTEYAYRLLGFEKKWNYSGSIRLATYTNLPKGDYTLQVRSTNSDRVWVHNTRTIDIQVLPSFWETPWAYMLYALGLVAVIAVSTYVLSTFYRLRQKVVMEREISDIKLKFFTHVSHELRTPLTLIYGFMKETLRRPGLDDTLRQQLEVVSDNAHRMLRLTNQILDIRKIENQQLRMTVRQIDLIPFIRDIMRNFDNIAHEHHIDYTMATTLESLVVWADADQLDKIIFNLLGNAFKYTPIGKSITVSVEADGQGAVIRVADCGVGISRERQKTIFEEYRNFIDRDIYDMPGTGLGLSLVKQLVALHGGSISVESEEGQGATFTVILQGGRDHFGPDTEFVTRDAVTIATTKYNSLNKYRKLMGQKGSPFEKRTLLIVEDNPDMRYLLETILMATYTLIEAENGQQGIDRAREMMPDLIVSDIMMPVMDGQEMLRQLRADINTSHIPVILLTAKSDDESQIDSMQNGADSYIVKPFNADLLKARITNLLEQRCRLQTFYQQQLSTLPSSPASTTTPNTSQEQETDRPLMPDEKFLQQVNASVRKNISNGSFTVDDMAGAVFMSRSCYFKKLKAITGMSPNEYLKAVRMQRAAELISQSDRPMGEIAFDVGINDSHYFSSCFKKQYGITPTEYRNRRNRK